MIKGERQRQILEEAGREGGMAVSELAGKLGVSRMTIRRDLLELERGGLLSRTHGGALLSEPGAADYSFRERSRAHSVDKRAIGLEVAGMIGAGMSVSLDTGTTTLEIARRIGDVERLTVLTSSLAVASALYMKPNVQVVLPGGTVRKGSPDISGSLAEENLKRFRVDMAVLGADAVTSEGTFATDVGIARISAAMVANAQKVVVAADSSKFSERAFVRCIGLDSVDCFVTDGNCPALVRVWLEEAVREVRYAGAAR